MRTGKHLIWLCCIWAIALLGCQAKHEGPSKPPEIRVPPAQAAVIGKGLELEQQHSKARKNAENPPAADAPKAARHEENKSQQRQHVMLAAADSPEKQPPAGAGKFKFEVPQAVDAIAAEIRDS